MPLIGRDVHKATISVAIAQGERNGEVLHRPDQICKLVGPAPAVRDLVRARATAMRVTGKARQHLQGFLLRHGRIYPGKNGRTVPFRRRLTTVRFEHAAQQIAFQDYVDAVADAEARVAKHTTRIAEFLPDLNLASVVKAIQAVRGRVSDLLCMSDSVHASPKGSMHDHLERNPGRTVEGRGAP